VRSPSAERVVVSARVASSEARRKRMKRSSIRFESAGSASMRLETFASVLKRKCGSI